MTLSSKVCTKGGVISAHNLGQHCSGELLGSEGFCSTMPRHSPGLCCSGNPALPFGPHNMVPTAAAGITHATVLYQAPRLLDLLPPHALNALLATCSQIHQLLQHSIISVSLAGCEALHGCCCLLAQSHWPTLQNLDFATVNLNSECMAQLSLGHWPLLRSLNPKCCDGLCGRNMHAKMRFAHMG